MVCIQEGDEWKRMFKTCYDHFEYVVMSFGLTNVPIIFQHFMNNVFCDYLDNFMVYYIDIIFIFSKNMEVYIWIWKSFEKLDFMPNWRSVNSINLR